MLHEDTGVSLTNRRRSYPQKKGRGPETSLGLIFLKLSLGEGVGASELAGETGVNCGTAREVEGGHGGGGAQIQEPPPCLPL